MTSPCDVLLLGWKAPAALELSRLGVRVTCVVEPGREVSSDAVHRVVRCPDPADASAVVSALVRNGLRVSGFQHVLSAKEFPLVAAAILGSSIGSVAAHVETAVALRDKLVQKRCVAAAGVATAEAILLEDESDLALLTGSTDVVIKPVAGGGSHDTFVLRHGDGVAYDRAVALVRQSSPVVAEAFVKGAELHADGVVRGGEVRVITVSRYLENLIRVSEGALVGSVIQTADADPGLGEDMSDLASRALRAIGHHDGIFHLEAFETPDGLVFSECAGRSGGGGIPRAFREATGIDLHRAWALAALGKDDRSRPQHYSEGTFGQVRLVRSTPAGPTSTEVLAQPGVVWADVAKGPVSRDPRSGSDVASGWAVARAASAGLLAERLRSLAAWFAEGVW